MAESTCDLDLLHFPDIPTDFNLPLGFSGDLDLDFDGDLDFVADLLDFADIEDDSPPESKEACGNSSSSSISSDPRTLNAQSPDSGDSSTRESNFRDSSVKLEEEEEKKGCCPKRKKFAEDGEISYTDLDDISRNNKFRRSVCSDLGNSASVFSPGNEDEDKRKARLMRNRESAQLSRQRKKHYVEELEEKVKSMQSAIADLNRKMTFIVAENSTLRQQLNGAGANSGNSNRSGVYPAAFPVHFPWIPYSGYPSRPQGAQVPLVPIPRLKQQQVASAPKGRKQEIKKSETKTKKLASVSLLGILFCMLFVGVIVPGVNQSYEGSRDLVGNDHPRGRVLTVGGNSDQRRNVNVQGMEKSSHNASDFSGNSKKPLLASLYVPRNNKLVKIDGNLIIQSVLASEKAIARNSDQEEKSDKQSKETTSLAIAGTLESGRGTEKNSVLYKSIVEYEMSRGFRSKDRSKTASADAPAKEWFQEGLEGLD